MARMVVMAGYDVRAGKDHLETFRNKKPLDAIAELVWNGLDADASRVTVNLDTDSIIGRGSEHVARVTVADNGTGISHERALEEFPRIGDSWKRRLNGKTPAGRILHGNKGRGRFYAYALGGRVRWTSVYSEDSKRYKIVIDGDTASINHFEISEPTETDEDEGTLVEITAEQGKPLLTLLKDDFWLRLLGLLASQLIASPDAAVTYRSRTLDPSPLMKQEPVSLELTDIPTEALGGHPNPTLSIVEWKEEAGIGPALILCSSTGAGLSSLELGRLAVPLTAYLRWAGFESPSADLMYAESQFSEVVDSARSQIEKYVGEKVEELQTQIVQQLRDEGSYPFQRAPQTAVEVAERDLYHHVLVITRSVLKKGSRQQRALTAQLLRVALEERPEDLDNILQHVLALSAEVRQELGELLNRSSLPSIVRASSTVTQRIDLLIALRHMLYDTDDSKQMREVDQLHPLVAVNEWLFGEDWKLSRSEASLTNVIRAVASDSVLLEEELQEQGGRLTDEDGKSGRVDLLLHRQFTGPTGRPERLVVELKRPSTTLNESHLTQAKGYARTLSKHQGVAPGRWTVWLVGTSMNDAVEAEASQEDREEGLAMRRPDFEVWVVTWGNLIDRALQRLGFLREQLNYEVTQLDAVGRLRERYGDLVPPGAQTS